MSVKEQILLDIKEAMKAKDIFKRDTLRLLSSSLKQVEVDERIELSDERVFQILQSEIKKRNDAVEQYTKGGRDELAKKESEEALIIASYLPKQLSDDEIMQSLKVFAKEISVSEVKDLGKLIAYAREKLGASADGKRISQAAKEILSKS